MKVAFAAAAAAVIGFAFAESALAAEFEGELVACPSIGTAIGDVGSCGKIWKLTYGEAELASNGHLKVKVKGLVLNDTTTGEYNGTPDGVDAVAAAVLCHGPGGAKVVAQTEPVALSKQGNATIEAKLKLPGKCIAPVIVLRERYEGKIGGWLAATGVE